MTLNKAQQKEIFKTETELFILNMKHKHERNPERKTDIYNQFLKVYYRLKDYENLTGENYTEKHYLEI